MKVLRCAFMKVNPIRLICPMETLTNETGCTKY